MADNSDPANERSGRNVEAFYDALMEAHEGLTLEQCLRMDVRLILILAERIGDVGALNAALAAARQSAK